MLDGVKQRAKEQNRTDEVIGVGTVGTVGTLYPPSSGLVPPVDLPPKSKMRLTSKF